MRSVPLNFDSVGHLCGLISPVYIHVLALDNNNNTEPSKQQTLLS